MNEHLARLKIAGASEGVKSAVSLEVAQLAIECTDPRRSVIARSADRWAPTRCCGGSCAAVPRPRRRSAIALALFDVRAGTPPRRVEKTFEGTEAARAGVGELVSTAFAPAGATP